MVYLGNIGKSLSFVPTIFCSLVIQRRDEVCVGLAGADSEDGGSEVKGAV